MRVLFIHPTYASQFFHLVGHLARGGHEITFLSSDEDRRGEKRTLGYTAAPIAGVRHVFFRYRTDLKHKGALIVQRFADEVFQGKAVYDQCMLMRADGYRPDIMVCHGRWGAALLLKEAYPDVPLLLYAEFFATAATTRQGLALGETLATDMELGYRLAGAASLISLNAADHVVTPTEFQRGSHPAAYWPKMSVIFDGVDAAQLAPQPVSEIVLGKRTLTADDEAVTYVARDFDPFRGFESFMRAAELVLRERPKARILIGGGAGGKGYGDTGGEAYRRNVLAKLSLDRSRVHFLGPLTYEQLVHLLRFSRVHVYLTRPFVLSWSLMEAMSLGCAIVGSRTAPVEEVIGHDENGLLAGIDDPADIAAQIGRLLDDAALRRRLAAAARQTILDRYDVRVVMPRYQALLGSLTA